MEDAAEVPGGGETGEVRKIRVVYFLSRNGRTEQPHLMRVHHRHRNGGGVRLRDVKRWLSELRGKYLPESHAWSYKRRYKSGYVWLDITDDDLITPVDDNEYVLMGSFIPTMVTLDDEIKNGNTNPADVSDCHAKSNLNPTPAPAPTTNNDKNISGDYPPPSAVAGVNKSASSSSSSSSKSRKFPDYDDVEMEEEECPRRCLTTYVDVSTQTPTIATFTTFDLLRADVVAKKTFQEKEVGDPVREKSIRSKSTMALGDSRKGAGGEKRVASNMFRNLITCGGSETRDSAMIPFDRRQMVGVAGEKEKSEKHRQSKSPPPPPMPESPSTNVDVLEDAKKSRNYNGKHTTFPEPICSECGKSFNPEKLFSHMNSCEVSRRRRNSRHQESSLVKRDEANNAAVFSLKLYHS